MITEPGFYPDLTPSQYFAEPCPETALTNSGIGMLLDNVSAKFVAGVLLVVVVVAVLVAMPS